MSLHPSTPCGECVAELPDAQRDQRVAFFVSLVAAALLLLSLAACLRPTGPDGGVPPWLVTDDRR